MPPSPGSSPPLPPPGSGQALLSLRPRRWRSTPQVRGRDAGVAEELRSGSLTAALRLGAGLEKGPSAEVAPLPQTSAHARPACRLRVSGGRKLLPSSLRSSSRFLGLGLGERRWVCCVNSRPVVAYTHFLLNATGLFVIFSAILGH